MSKADLRRWLLLVVGLAIVLSTLYWGVVFGGKTFVLRDAHRFTLPSREFLAQSLAQGRIPEWWNGVGFGVAFTANPVHAVASPLSWPLALLPIPWAFDAQTLVELLLLSLGTAVLTRRLGGGWPGACLSALVMVLCGYVGSTIPNGNVPYIAWIPWVAWAALQRMEAAQAIARTHGGALFAGAVALQLLAGEPGHTLVAALIVLALALAGERPLQRMSKLLLPAAAGVALAAVGLLPALLLLPGSARAHLADAGPLKWSMPPGRLLEFIWPLPFGSAGSESWFVSAALGKMPSDPCFALSLSVGVPVLLLALGASAEARVRRLLYASVIFVLLAFGSYTPLYGLLRAVLPPLRVINFPEKFVFGALLLWSASAGVGLARVLRDAPPKWMIHAAVAAAATLATAGAAVGVWRSSIQAWLTPHALGVRIGPGLTLSIEGAVFAALASAMFAMALVAARRGRRAPALILCAAGVGLPLVFADLEITPLVSRATVERRPAILRNLPRPPLAQSEPEPRLFHFPAPHFRPPFASGEDIGRDIHETLDSNVAARFGYDVIPGFETGDSALSRRLWEEVSPRMSLLAFVRLLGVDFALVPDPDGFAPGFPVLARMPGWGIVGTFPVRPRAFVTPRTAIAHSARDGLESLAAPGRDRDPVRIVLSGEGAEALDTPGPIEPCLLRSTRPEVVQLDCTSPNGGYTVLLDEDLPGWSAELDRSPARILTADGLFCAVRVGPGAHKIAFRYRTPGLRLGALISAVTLAGIAAVLVRAGRRG